MFRGLLIVTFIFTASVSWSLDWNGCNKDLKAVRDKSSEAAVLTINQRNLYDTYETKKFEYDLCIDSHGDCQYLQLTVNKILIDYKKWKRPFR